MVSSTSKVEMISTTVKEYEIDKINLDKSVSLRLGTRGCRYMLFDSFVECWTAWLIKLVRSQIAGGPGWVRIEKEISQFYLKWAEGNLYLNYRAEVFHLCYWIPPGCCSLPRLPTGQIAKFVIQFFFKMEHIPLLMWFVQCKEPLVCRSCLCRDTCWGDYATA